MKTTAAVAALMGVVSARELNSALPLMKREVDQEHSHQNILDIVNPLLQQNNPLEIKDAVFGLLGNKAAAGGAPNVQDLDCLQQIIADQAFTNALAAGDIDGQANAIIFRALERNTNKVGLASVLCTQVAVNAEIAAITQHQDPASPEASGNAAIELAVAQQLANIGADPNDALKSATFAPGDVNDPTAEGNGCDDANDKAGCINTLNRLTPAVSQAQIAAAVQGGGAAAAAAGAGAGAAKAGAAAAGAGAAKEAAAGGKAEAATATADAAAGVNVQSFNGQLGGPPPAVISSAANADRPFSVNGATFVNEGAALARSCDVQKNACSNAANSGQIQGGTAQCEAQGDACRAAAGAAKKIRKLRRAALDLGSCSNPAIVFGAGFDGRKEDSFEPADLSEFSHGSALNIKVISDFICNNLVNKCGLDNDSATVAACKQASTAAQAQKGQAAADAFNNALGVSA